MEGNEIIDEHMIRIKYREFYVCDDSEKEGEDEKRREEEALPRPRLAHHRNPRCGSRDLTFHRHEEEWI